MSVLEELDALGAKVSPLPWTTYRWRVAANGMGDIAHFFMSQPPCNDNAAYAALAVNHLRPLVAALDEIAWPLKHRQECAGRTVLLKTTADLQEIAEQALAALQRDIAKLGETG